MRINIDKKNNNTTHIEHTRREKREFPHKCPKYVDAIDAQIQISRSDIHTPAQTTNIM